MLVFEVEREVLRVITDCKLNCLTSEEISNSLKSNPFSVFVISFFKIYSVHEAQLTLHKQPLL